MLNKVKRSILTVVQRRISDKRTQLGEALSTEKPGGDLLGDLKAGESSVAKAGAGGGDVGGYPILSKMLGSGDFFA